MTAVVIGLFGLLASLVGCVGGPSAMKGGFNSDDPAAKLYAIQRAGESGDVEKIPPLVEQLESDDPAVRVWAIQALERITGQRLGYNAYGSPINRRKAIDRWLEAIAEDRFAEGGGSETNGDRDNRMQDSSDQTEVVQQGNE